MASGDKKIILGQQPLWQGDKGGMGMYGICPINDTGGCGWHLHPGGVAVSPVDVRFQAVPQHHGIMEYLLQSLGPRKGEKPPGPPLPEVLRLLRDVLPVHTQLISPSRFRAESHRWVSKLQSLWGAEPKMRI